MTKQKDLDAFIETYRSLAKKCKQENRMLLNHVCLRVENLDETEKMLEEAFGLKGFIRPGGELFDGEKDLSVLWINDEFYLELMEPKDKQTLGYQTGAQPIGHLSEVGFFVPDMDEAQKHLGSLGWKVTTQIKAHGASMCKMDKPEPTGFPVELIDVDLNEA